MKQYLLRIEFRYNRPHSNPRLSGNYSKFTTLGVYDELSEAVHIGNEYLKKLPKTFTVRYNDTFKVKGLFGNPDLLVTNVCYGDKVQFFFKIEPLHFDPLDLVINEVLESDKEYRKQKLEELNDD